MGSEYLIGANHCCKRRLPPPLLRSVTLETPTSSWNEDVEKARSGEDEEDESSLNDKPSKETTATKRRTRAPHAHAATAG